MENREKIIIRTSWIGILANILLAAFKAAVRILSQSIAVTMDAVNNLSDALSSFITIIGTRLAQKSPDKKHPLGYGRVEYLSASVISLIVLYAGITAFAESVKKIISPQTPDYSRTALIIIGVAVIVKVLLGTYVKKMGKKTKSKALAASGSDALFDSVISASTLVAALLYLIFHISLEAWLGAVIASVIVKSGFEMLRDTISEILGERVNADLARAVKKTISSFPEVRGAYDLVIDNYGPKLLIGSVHIELPDTMTVEETDTLERAITHKVFMEHGVAMAGISVYASNTKNDAAADLEHQIREIVRKYPAVLQIHGFYIKGNRVRFDIIIDFDADNRLEIYEQVVREMQSMFPDYEFDIFLDTDVSE